MGAYKYLQSLWRKKQCEIMTFVRRMRTWEFRQLPVIHRANRPSRPEKARKVGYKTKQGYVIYRVRIRRGGRKNQVPKGIVYGKIGNSGVNEKKPRRNHRAIAETRVGRKLNALKVLNSYWVGQDSTFKFFEVICIDAGNTAIRNDPKINWIVDKKHREQRGLTAAGVRARGLTNTKGGKSNNKRPSRRANYLRRNQVKLRRYR
jgi:large subunit ribosomal protein L15e